MLLYLNNNKKKIIFKINILGKNKTSRTFHFSFCHYVYIVYFFNFFAKYRPRSITLMGRRHEGDAHSLDMYNKQIPFYSLFLSKIHTHTTFGHRFFELKALLYTIREIVGRYLYILYELQKTTNGYGGRFEIIIGIRV